MLAQQLPELAKWLPYFEEIPSTLLSAAAGIRLISQLPAWLQDVYAPRDNRTWAERRYRGLVQWYGAPPPPGVPVASICSGVFILAAAGLLDGRRATAHWAQAELLSSRYPTVNVDPNVLYVDDGDIKISAGRAAGLDLCLHIVRRDYRAEIANRVAQRLVVPPHREGGQAQYIPQPVRKVEGDALASIFAWAQHHLDQDLAIDRLASRTGMSRRTFIRRFEEETGMSPGDWVVQARVSRARELLEATQLPIEYRGRDRLRLG